MTARRLAETGRFDAIICLGCVIKGETMHFEYIAAAVSQGIMDVGTATGIPVTFGVLTTLTDEQAAVRAAAGTENKGREAALAAIEMATLWRQIREAAVQMLYQWEVGRVSMDEVLRMFWSHPPEGTPLTEDLRAFATSLASGTADHVAELDPLIVDAADNWRIERMNVLDRLILRLAVYEFLHEPETPGKVIINEALELARSFSADDSVRFINGILDAIRRTLSRE